MNFSHYSNFLIVNKIHHAPAAKYLQRRGLRERRHFLEELVEQHTSLQWVYVLELMGARQICAQAQPLNSSDLSLSLRLCLLPPSL